MSANPESKITISIYGKRLEGHRVIRVCVYGFGVFPDSLCQLGENCKVLFAPNTVRLLIYRV